MRIWNLTATSLALTLFPALAFADTALENPLGTDVTVWDIFGRLAGGLNFVTGTLALVFVIFGGYTILTAAGNSERYQKGKKMIGYAILGLFVTVASYAILATSINILTGGTQFREQAGLFDPLGLVKDPNAAFTFYGGRILKTMLSVLGSLTLLMFVYGGLTWMTAAGNEEKVGKAHKIIGYAVLGLIIVLSSYVGLRYVYVPFYAMLSGS